MPAHVTTEGSEVKADHESSAPVETSDPGSGMGLEAAGVLDVVAARLRWTRRNRRGCHLGVDKSNARNVCDFSTSKERSLSACCNTLELHCNRKSRKVSSASAFTISFLSGEILKKSALQHISYVKSSWL